MTDNLNEKVGQILNDLYELDPGFRQHEARLKTIILELLEAKPAAKFDAEFAAGLRRRLLAQATVANGSDKGGAWSFLSKRRLAFSGIAIAVVAVAAAGGLYAMRSGRQGVLVNRPVQLFATKAEIRPAGTEAFGKLSMQSAGGRGGGYGAGGSAPVATDNSAGAQSLSTPEATPTPDGAAAAPKMAGGDAYTMPAYYTYKYVYKGEEFTVPVEDQSTVLRKVKGLASGFDASSVLSRLNFGLFDVGSFSQLKLQSLSLVEDKNYGYNIYVDAQNGSVSVSENWYKWPDPARNCRDEACYQSYRLKLQDVPDDGALVAIANQFLADHNISHDNFGQPFVSSLWKREYELMQDKSQFFVPDVISVVYPLQLDGKDVFDEGGNRAGLMVNVNIRARRPAGVSELSAQRYESSSYPMMTAMPDVVSIAERGGLYGGYAESLPAGGRQVELALGTPHFGLVKFYQYHDGTQDELYAPAMIFPVTTPPQPGHYYQQNVVVPLAKDLIQSAGGPIRIMK